MCQYISHGLWMGWLLLCVHTMHSAHKCILLTGWEIRCDSDCCNSICVSMMYYICEHTVCNAIKIDTQMSVSNFVICNIHWRPSELKSGGLDKSGDKSRLHTLFRPDWRPWKYLNMKHSIAIYSYIYLQTSPLPTSLRRSPLTYHHQNGDLRD